MLSNVRFSSFRPRYLDSVICLSNFLEGDSDIYPGVGNHSHNVREHGLKDEIFWSLKGLRNIALENRHLLQLGKYTICFHGANSQHIKDLYTNP